MPLRAIVFSLCASLVSTTAVAATPQWAPIGPFGGGATRLRFVPGVKGEVYAVSPFGVFASTNSGSSWAPITYSIGPLEDPESGEYGSAQLFEDMAFSSGSTPDLYVLSKESAYKWNSSSSSWQQILYVNDPQYGLIPSNGNDAQYMAVDPFNSQHILVLGLFDYQINSDADETVTEFESTDGGTSFHLIMPNAKIDPPQGILHFAPGRAGLVFADDVTGGGSGSHFEISIDGGETWQYIGNPPNDGNGPFAAYATSDPDPDRIYAIRYMYTGSRIPGLYRSDDQGVSWQFESSIPLTLPPDHLLADPVDPDTIYISGCVGVTTGSSPPQNFYKSSDGGQTWSLLTGFQAVDNTEWCPAAVAVDPSAGSHILVGGVYWGISSSTDGGQSFLPADPGFIAADTQGVAVDNSAIPTLYSGGLGTFPYRSTDGGMHWYPFFGGNIGTQLSGIGNDWLNPQYVYAMTSSSLGVLAPGASTWSSESFPDTLQGTIDGSPVTAGTVYTDSSTTFGDPDSTSLYVSTDYGNTWQDVLDTSTSFPVPFAPSHITADLIYYSDGSNVYHSTDNGNSWSALSGSVAGSTCGSCDWNLATAVDSDQILLWSGGTLIFKTSDGGNSWAQVYQSTTGSLPAIINNLYADPVSSGDVYALLNTGMALSTDDGSTWGPVPNSGLTNHSVVALKHVPWNSSYIYAGTNDAGLFSLTIPTDLAVSISDVSGELTAGTAVPFTVTVVNNGSATAAPASLDLLPSGNTTVNVTGAGEATCQSAGSMFAGELICDLPSLAPGASWTLYADVTPGNAQTASLMAWATSLQGESNWADNAVTTMLYPVPLADMGLSMSPAPSTITTGSQAALFSVTVSNHGPETTDAKVFINYDTSASNVTISPSSGCTQGSSGYECVLTSTAAESSTTYTLSGAVSSYGTFTASASVVPTSNTDPDNSNNTATLAQTVLPVQPQVAGAVNQTVTVGSALSTEALTLSGGEPLTVSVSSSNTQLLQNSALSLSSGCGTTTLSCTLTMTASAKQTGTATVTVSLQDGYGQSGSGSFTVTVNSAQPTKSSGGSGGGGGGGGEGLLALASLLVLGRSRRKHSLRNLR